MYSNTLTYKSVCYYVCYFRMRFYWLELYLHGGDEVRSVCGRAFEYVMCTGNHDKLLNTPLKCFFAPWDCPLWLVLITMLSFLWLVCALSNFLNGLICCSSPSFPFVLLLLPWSPPQAHLDTASLLPDNGHFDHLPNQTLFRWAMESGQF